MTWQLQFLIVYMSIFRSDMDFPKKEIMLEFARRDFGISKVEHMKTCVFKLLQTETT